jgi:hypothetical protein
VPINHTHAYHIHTTENQKQREHLERSLGEHLTYRETRIRTTALFIRKKYEQEENGVKSLKD